MVPLFLFYDKYARIYGYGCKNTHPEERRCKDTTFPGVLLQIRKHPLITVGKLLVKWHMPLN